MTSRPDGESQGFGRHGRVLCGVSLGKIPVEREGAQGSGRTRRNCGGFPRQALAEYEITLLRSDL